MRARGPRFLVIILVAVIVLAAVLVLRARGDAELGPSIARCPGPDQYGYTCLVGPMTGYVEATLDTGLYLDDGLVELDLPFEFTFYGTAYSGLRASSNGNLQFTSASTAFRNLCLTAGPAEGLGDMIAPYWDDLDLTHFGMLETEVVGEAPERTFVIEWDDVPSFADQADRVTFEVQLSEGSNDIRFVYQDVARNQGNRGSLATVGIQSELSGFALQHSCDEFALADNSAISFTHPPASTTNSSLQTAGVVMNQAQEAGPTPKGDGAAIFDRIVRSGLDGLQALRAYWLGQSPSRDSQWVQSDLNGDGVQELVYLLSGPTHSPDLALLVVLESETSGDWSMLLQSHPAARLPLSGHLNIHGIMDVTGEGNVDLLLRDKSGGHLLVVSGASGTLETHLITGRCSGPLLFHRSNSESTVRIVREGCEKQDRLVTTWSGDRFLSE